MPLVPYKDKEPSVGADVTLAPDAYLAAEVIVHGPARIESRAALRGDQNFVAVGPRVFIGAGTSLHVEIELPTRVGSDVWVGEGCVIHASTVGDAVRVEDGALILSGCTIGAGSVIEAHALVTEGSSLPENSYVAGSPSRRLRDTTPEERQDTVRHVAAALDHS